MKWLLKASFFTYGSVLVSCLISFSSVCDNNLLLVINELSLLLFSSSRLCVMILFIAYL